MVTSRPIRRDAGGIQGWELRPIRAEHLERVDVEASPAAEQMAVSTSARIQAEELLSGARAQADRILAAAREQALQIQTAAFKEGFADGQARGLEELGPSRRRLDELCEQIQGAYQGFCEQQMPALVGVATVAAERLLDSQLTLEPERIADLVRGALSQVTSSSAITVRLHPDDVEMVQRRTASMDGATGVRLVADATIQQGGCRIESEQGEVDATIEGRTARLARVLTQTDED